MTWLVEEPLYIAILGIITIAFLFYAWTQTGYRWMMHAMFGAIALTLGLLLLEHLVDTEAELIEKTVHQIARDCETNDIDRILPHVYSGAPVTADEAKREFGRYVVSDVDIKHNLEVRIVPNESPPLAEVSFNVGLSVRERREGGIGHPAVRLFVELTMRKEGGQWKVATYRYQEPTASIRIPER